MSTEIAEVELVKELTQKVSSLKSEISKVIVGQDEIVNSLLLSILSKGHCLLIGVPGLAKTLIIKTISDVLDLSFNRIQFTPDLMPSDITGTEIFDEDPKTGRKGYRFIGGPIFANVVLADEINRTPPKTQSALLEAMQENKVTNAGVVYNLPQPFFVLATQNPIEQEGTYPLPEAQLDRFMFSLKLQYPSFEEEVNIVKQTTGIYKPSLQKILNAAEIKIFQDLVRKIPVADNVVEYAVNFVNKTRPNLVNSFEFVKNNVRWGAGPRASQYLILAAKARCIIKGQYSPSLDDVKDVCNAVLRHRIILSFNAEAEGITSEDIIEYIKNIK